MSAQTIASGSRRPHVWEDLINDEIREISPYYGGFAGLGERPALLCIDNYNAVFGDRAEPLKDAIKRFPSTCGPSAWAAIEPTKKLMAAARTAGIPVLHTTRAELEPTFGPGIYSTKRERPRNNETEWNYSLFSQLAALDTEVVIPKPRASAFFGTALGARLTQLRADSIIVCGNSTSGCIRASVSDAFMNGYGVCVVEECVFDRNTLSHKVNLLDMQMKYADVMFLDDVLAYIEKLAR
ncbi:isochorismatase family protein [Pusillimonas noertemannii]|uniref:Nicotinamidase-related amidase n=1 Tax=Pusillimonas noertemannii TaxID=305977 RepID=A0A2U1CMT7_9BURK|nr:isochorismatase family protein [Pusillimonas noertemannii]NYT68649.1 isochorismatase family protein [Pusillimonas noertemannii]PVY62333.1 nicotinamidase-related amidase [Pusillimonas noertemannii]